MAVDGEYYAVRDVCTHDDGPLGEGDLDGCQLICPRHGARFDSVEDVASRPKEQVVIYVVC